MTWSDKIGPVQYHIGGTITYTTNKLIDLGATSVLKSGFVGKQQGYPLNSYFGLRYVGKIQTQEELENTNITIWMAMELECRIIFVWETTCSKM